MIELDVIDKTPVATEPFPHFVSYGIITKENMKAISADFPVISKPGVFPLSDLQYGAAFAKLIEEVRSEKLAKIVGDKLGMNLVGKPLLVTARGQCQMKDGRIHNDSRDKIATCLLYLNDEEWDAKGGRLRLLRDDHNIENYITEVPPNGGNMIAFRRTENSWHGHDKFVGQRRSIMFNWLASDFAYAKNVGRHKLSAFVKKLGIKTKSEY